MISFEIFLISTLIYKIYLIDGNNGISILNTSFKEFQKDKIDDNLIPGFFTEINAIIDKIQEAMVKGKREEEFIRMLESEYSVILIYYHSASQILFCSISDADDDTEKLVEVIHKIANRFWKKHKSDIKNFRTTTEKSPFKTIIADIENLCHGGHIAEIFPKLMIVKLEVLEKILSMGMINDFDYQVALKCTGENSPLKISKIIQKPKTKILDSLKNLKDLDIISM
ncbi:MAG: hypothetical protein ACTSV5_00560 [Promethearchaeota archaeon]